MKKSTMCLTLVFCVGLSSLCFARYSGLTDEGAPSYRYAAENGDASAQYRLGQCYAIGHGVAKDARKAVELFEKSAKQGYAAAYYELATHYLHGKGVAKDEAQAIAHLRTAATKGFLPAQRDMGYVYAKGVSGVKQDLNEAEKWYTMAAKQGDERAVRELAEIQKRLTTKNPAEAIFLKGKDYYEAENYTEAVKSYRQAAEMGYAPAQYELARCYRRGRGVEENEAEAEKWMKKAADAGYGDALWSMGNDLCYGRNGKKKNPEEGVKLLRQAADKGHVQSQYDLGMHYLMARDKKQAKYWFNKAAAQGHSGAKGMLSALR